MGKSTPRKMKPGHGRAARATFSEEQMLNGFKNLAIGLALSVLSLLFTACIGEASFRIYQRFQHPVSRPSKTGHKQTTGPGFLTRDEDWGWRPTENYHYVGTRNSADGSQYSVTITQNENGFRMFGDLHSSKPKLLVIGDSFTHAIEVSDDKTYYATVKKLLGVEVFAFGGGGYGTLQEYLVLDRFLDQIKPDLIVWQYCSNDFINNSPELETRSWQNNNSMVRPYWVNGHIQYILPKYGGSLRKIAMSHSRLMYYVSTRLDKMLTSLPSVETDIEREWFKHQGFVDSVEVTDELMGMVKRRAGRVPVVAFSADDDQPYTNAFEEISQHHDIPYLEEVAQAVIEAEKRGVVCRAEDQGHWNETGHQIAGQTLAAYLRKMGFVTSPVSH